MKKVWLLLTGSLILGLCSFAIQFSAARPVELNDPISEFATVPVEFQLLDRPTKFSKSNRYTVNIKITSAEIGKSSHNLVARGMLRGAEELAKLQVGASYSCDAELRKSEPAERAGFYASCSSEIILISAAPAGNSSVELVRQRFMRSLSGVDPDSSGLVAGLAIGDVSKISARLSQNMKSVSLTHLTAVSGANCAIVLAMFYLLVRKLGGGRLTRLLVGLVALIGYVFLVGAQPSVLRAAVMAGAVLIGISLGRRSGALNALGLSILILLIADPWLAVDFGFALSATATAGLLIVTQPLTAILSRRLPQWLAVAISVSLAAQIFCLPILLQLQGGLATYSLPANLLAEPLVAPITVLGICACLVAWCFPFLGSMVTYAASVFAWLITWIANTFAELPNTTLSWPSGPLGAAVACCVIIAVLLWLRAEPTKLRNWGIISLGTIAAISSGAIGFTLVKSAQWPLRDWVIVACDVDQGDAIVVRSQSAVALIDVGPDDKRVDHCLTRLDIQKIDLLVLTHFDMDHIGGLRGAIGGREVKLTLVSPFKDKRWGATGTNRYLADQRIKTVLAEKGMSGSLGDFDWQVLSPNRNAESAEDSNDASIVMSWQSPSLNFLSMADSGERAQMRISADRSWWTRLQASNLPLVLKVSHHGSSDQFGELIEALNPELSLVSVGRNNSYGHPTSRTLDLLNSTGSTSVRTDLLGSIAVASRDGDLVISNAPRG